MSSTDRGTRPARSPTAKSARSRPETVRGASVRNPARLRRETAAVGRAAKSCRERRVVRSRAPAGSSESRSGGPPSTSRATSASSVHGQEGRARDAETPRNPVREEVLQVLERTRRRQLADEREQALAIPQGLAILKARKSGGQAPAHGSESERHQKSGGDLQRGPRVRNAHGDGLREEELGKREEAGSHEKGAEHGRRLAAEDLDVPQAVPRERREKGGWNERERKHRERRDDRDRAAEKAGHEVQEDEGKEAHESAEQEEADLFFRQEVRRAAARERRVARPRGRRPTPSR